MMMTMMILMKMRTTTTTTLIIITMRNEDDSLAGDMMRVVIYIYITVLSHHSDCHRAIQLIQNSLARAVTRTSSHYHVNPVIKSLHCLKIPERIHFKVLSLTYNSLQSSQTT